MTGMRLSRLVLAGALASTGAWADDRWEGGGTLGCNDDGNPIPNTCNVLQHGVPQIHDLQGITVAPDIDWMIVNSKSRHSYEVRVRSSTIRFSGAGCTNCPGLTRLDAVGNVLSGGFPPDSGSPVDSAWSHTQVVRWIAPATDQRDFIVMGTETFFDLTPNDQYEIELLDTTYFVPRWNQSGTQSTIFLIQNTSPALVTGSVLFHGPSGTLLASAPLSIPRNGLQVLSAGSIPGLAGQGGSAAIVHDGGYGALVGKAVALEPATGFTFDTPLAALPR